MTNKKPTKLEESYLIKKATEIKKDWMETGRNPDKKYFGYLNKNTLSIILIITLILVIVGDAFLIHNFLAR